MADPYPPTLRERNKQKRRNAILDAAFSLLGENDARLLTVERIADRAEVSPATVYNLVGSRESLFVQLFDRGVSVQAESLAPLQAEADLMSNILSLTSRSTRFDFTS